MPAQKRDDVFQAEPRLVARPDQPVQGVYRDRSGHSRTPVNAKVIQLSRHAL